MISILILTYGDRFNYLKQVLDACVLEYKNKKDKIFEIVIVDNNSLSSEKIREYININLEVKFRYIFLDKNLGSAGGYSAGLKYFLDTDSDYVLLLDDDNGPEENFIDAYINALSIFPIKEKENLILSGRRIFTDINLFYGNKPFYSPKFLFGYNLFDPRVVLMLFKKHILKPKEKELKDFLPIYKKTDLAYGGSLIPKNVIKKAGFPLEYLFTYEDDFEYGLRMIENDFSIYQLFNPYIHDVDMSNRSDGFLSVFSEETGDFRVFYRVRNNAYLSYHIYDTNIILLFINLLLILIIFNLYFIFKYGFKKILSRRNMLIVKAFLKGIKKDFSPF